MTKINNTGNTEPTSGSMTKKDLKILENLMSRTESLPDILHLRAAAMGYEFTEEDKKLLLNTYEKLDDILKEVAAFINIRFPKCERHIRAWNEIDFDAKIGPFKVKTTDREHIKREWRNGIFDLKSLIKVLKNEVTLLIDEEPNYNTFDLKSLSSDNKLEFYTNPENIPNQNLVNETIAYFSSGDGAELFSAIDFLNLLDKQRGFLLINHKDGENVIKHLKGLPLSDRKKHTLYGFIFKWFGGYPVNNLNEDFDKTLKLVQKEFLAYDGDTPEKEFCKADQVRRNQFEKMGIAFTTAINHNIDVTEILEAMGEDEPNEELFHNFADLFAYVVKKGLIGSFNGTKEFLISQSAHNYEFNVWLQTDKGWEYRNEEQYRSFLTRELFSEFLNFKYSKVKKEQEKQANDKPIVVKNGKPSLREIALICHYTDRLVTRETAKTIVKEYQHNSGDGLFNLYTHYRSKSNRTSSELTVKKNHNKIRLFESVIDLLKDNDIARLKIEADFFTLKSMIGDFY